MSLSDGDPASDGDIWFRIVTQEKHLVRGRVHHSAFGGNAIAPPKDRNRGWDRELSGSLRSLAGTIDDIIKSGEEYCAAQKARGAGNMTFSGVMYTSVADATRNYENTVATGVHYTPLEHDPSHADLTFTGWIADTKDEKDRFLLWLTDIVYALHHPGQLRHLPQAIDPRTNFRKLLDFLFRKIRN
jgi:hypothetical protein